MSDNIFKPLAFDDDEPQIATSQEPLSFNDDSVTNTSTYHAPPSDFVPISGPTGIDRDSNFVFFFGSTSSGKSVLLSTMLYYLRSKAGALKPNLKTPNSREALNLYSSFSESISRGILPTRTVAGQVTRIDLIFDPNNRSQKTPSVNLSFLETAGEHHQDIKAGGTYHESIDAYLNAEIPLTFIIVTAYDRAHEEDSLINDFLDELERKGKGMRHVNIILVISKWDLSNRTRVTEEEELSNFIEERLPMTSNRLDTYQIARTYFTVGKIAAGENKIVSLNLDSAERLSNWIYRSITGYPFDYEGTLWEKIKFSFK